MPYQTGTVATPAALKTAIENFCTSNGWTLSGDWLSKGQSYIRLFTSPGVVSTITRSGATATVTVPNYHNFNVGDSVTISGATDSLYNGTFTVTSVGTGGRTSTTFTYTMSGTPAANASGTLEATGSINRLAIIGATGAGGTNQAPQERYIYIPNAQWPVTYHFFLQSTPDQFVCILNYQVTKIQTIMFGDIVKVHSSAYVGGNWYFATLSGINYYDVYPYRIYFSITNSPSETNRSFYSYMTIASSVYNNFCLPFFGSYSNAGYDLTAPDNYASNIHLEIDGQIWDDNSYNYITSNPFYQQTRLSDACFSTLYRSPNTWNNQATLVPLQLERVRPPNTCSYVGYIEHIRYVRITNYEIGDIVTLGSDRWKVFPCCSKDINYPNGRVQTQSGDPTIDYASGTLGYAIRYDGP